MIRTRNETCPREIIYPCEKKKYAFYCCDVASMTIRALVSGFPDRSVYIPSPGGERKTRDNGPRPYSRGARPLRAPLPAHVHLTSKHFVYIFPTNVLGTRRPKAANYEPREIKTKPRFCRKSRKNLFLKAATYSKCYSTYTVSNKYFNVTCYVNKYTLF